MNRRHMPGDHHGRMAGRATLLVRAVDEILGTHSICGRSWPSTRATATDDDPIAAARSARPDPTTLPPTSPRNGSSAGPSSAVSSTNTSEPHKSPGQHRWPSSGTPQASAQPGRTDASTWRPWASGARAGYVGSDLRELGPSVAGLIAGYGIPCTTVAAEGDTAPRLATWL